jgi:glycylpeptide N-tetradecanoyltransferase
MFVPKSLDRAVADAARSLFPDTWLDSPDDCVLPHPSSTPGYLPPSPSPSSSAAPIPKTYLPFPTNYHRFAAQELSKRLDTAAFTKKGFMLHAIAAGWHHKSASQLKEIAEKVGRERILVMHGTEDRMITVGHGRVLVEELGLGKGEGTGEGTVHVVEWAGHVLMLERAGWYNGVVEGMVEKTEGMGRG